MTRPPRDVQALAFAAVGRGRRPLALYAASKWFAWHPATVANAALR